VHFRQRRRELQGLHWRSCQMHERSWFQNLKCQSLTNTLSSTTQLPTTLNLCKTPYSSKCIIFPLTQSRANEEILKTKIDQKKAWFNCLHTN
jgi:hypothetical protein